jgi:hypothetical protein
LDDGDQLKPVTPFPNGNQIWFNEQTQPVVQISGERAKQEAYPEEPKSRGSKNEIIRKRRAQNRFERIRRVSKRIL